MQKFQTIQEYFGEVNFKWNIQNSLNERIVCIGDSYGVGTTYGGTIEGWCDRLKTLMGLSTSNYYKFVEGSSGFTRAGLQGHNFITLLQTNITNIENKETITIKGKALSVGRWQKHMYQLSGTMFLNGLYHWGFAVLRFYAKIARGKI